MGFRLLNVSDYDALNRLDTLMEVIKCSLRYEKLFTPKRVMRWTKDFTIFCAWFNMAYDTDHIEAGSKREAFEGFQEMMGFGSHKSIANFNSSSHAIDKIAILNDLVAKFKSHLETPISDRKKKK